jgi:phospholipid/cholesterol/gamma-HCH transport system ATP-binding protein
MIEMENIAVSSLGDVNHVVAEGVNWTVASGDYWVVAGLQGSGKSDFLMMTAGLMAPSNGTYRLFGESMPIFDEDRLATRLRLGLAFDGGQLFNHLTVWENVALPLRYHRNLSRAGAENRVKELLDGLGLMNWADSTPGALARNWHKRIGLARALSLEPELLLVDNPLAGLDLRHASWWLGFLDQLSRGHSLLGNRPVTLVISTADLRPWRSRARQFAVLRNKRLTVLGGWDKLESADSDLRRELFPAE